ncbi:MAG: hypothetical protein M9892_09045 [Bacteroidetes bacterium]|nr:hypothetical protein [Bacteroidota bacterium]
MKFLADAGYSSGEALQYLEENNINTCIPNFGQYKAEREGFIYNKEQNQYECIKTGGNKPYSPSKALKLIAKDIKKYIAAAKVVVEMSQLREACCGKVNKFKKIDDSIHKPLYDKMHTKAEQNQNYPFSHQTQK